MNYKIDEERRMDDTKLPWHMGRVYDRHIFKRHVGPIHLDVGISKFCNIACTYCFGFFQNPEPVYIQERPLMDLMTYAPQIGVKSIAFIGDGEPTMNPYLWDALKLGKKNGLDLSVSTNGIRLGTQDQCSIIANNCVWMRFCISAGTSEGYQKIHGKDHFNLVKENIKMMVNYRDSNNIKCEIGMQAVFVPTLMIDEMVEESKLAVDLGVDYFVIKQCSLPDEGQSGMSWFDVNYYDKPEVKEALQKCQDMSNSRTKIIPKWNVIMQKGQRTYKHCPAVSLISEISGNGNWYPCGYMFGGKPEFERYKFGNIQENNIREIFESDHYWNVIHEMETNFDSQVQCKGCCRLDKCNEFVYKYIQNPDQVIHEVNELVSKSPIPKGINFI